MTQRSLTPQQAAGLASELQTKDAFLTFEDSLQLAAGSFNQNVIPWSFSSPVYNSNNYGFNYNEPFQNYLTSLAANRYLDLISNPQTGWFNRFPVVTYGPELPIVTKAGQSAVAGFWAVDPDADMVYSSSNIGATGRSIGGGSTWTFSTNFPGLYSVDTVFYDERGGFTIVNSPVIVKPWWSF